jgi:hypothetical protein
MTAKLKIEATVHFGRERRSEKVVRTGEAPPGPPGRIPRISRMMALAIWFDELIQQGEVKNFAELAALGQVCRTRVTQIMNLLLLAPDIQEELLFLLRIQKGSDSLLLRDLQSVARNASWIKQRQIWKRCLQ